MRLTVGKKLVGGVSIMIFLIIIIGVLASNRISFINDNLTNIADSWLPGVELINRFTYLSEHVLTLTMQHINTDSLQDKQKFEEEIQATIEQATTTLNDYSATIYLTENRKNFNELLTKWDSYLTSNTVTLNNSRNIDKVAANYNLEKTIKTFKSMQTNLNALVEINKNGAVQASLESNTAMKTSQVIIIIGMIAGIILGGALVYLLNRAISKPLVRVTNTIKEVANGNLKVDDIEIKSHDEIGELATSVNTMKTELSKMITNMIVASQSVKSQSDDLTNAANELKLGAEQVASAIQQITSDAEEQATSSTNAAVTVSNFNNRIIETSENGLVLKQKAETVYNESLNGKQLMDQSVDQMKKINEIMLLSMEKVLELDKSNQNINQLVKVIRDIAEQTNLLALNAAIEAARAGEHGRGFAVVANEVKKLAEQVANSIKEITTITETIKMESRSVVESLELGTVTTKAGNEFIVNTGSTFDSIIEEVNAMVSLVYSVSDHLEQTKIDSDEINQFTQEMSSISEETAASTEQTSASIQQQASTTESIADSSKALSELSGELFNTVKKFKV
ncbi:methyl-accepting chemotaxis protein [Bacillus sp. Marseille-P3661]|uniref:methyl-accepting chemotaxis protein n=1 Tax=Bacillus sp. Marseille-P3661 TaxID=1936234 RepID=UPI000C84D607|nr:HAMP domain-containing methyl-accepting chemotaxis protein [Bacillus sp. Marseille-P3661]